MLVVMKAQATQEQIQAVCEAIERWASALTRFPEPSEPPSASPATRVKWTAATWKNFSGVAEVIRVSKAYKLASRDVKEEDTVIRFAGDGTHPMPSSAEKVWPSSPGLAPLKATTRPFAIAELVAASGAQFFRGGAYKPRYIPLRISRPGRRGAAHHG